MSSAIWRQWVEDGRYIYHANLNDKKKPMEFLISFIITKLETKNKIMTEWFKQNN